MNTQVIDGKPYVIANYVYDGILFYSAELLPSTIDDLDRKAQVDCPWIEIQPTYLTVRYKGEDSGRRILKFLCEVAPVIGNAEGEILCLLEPNNWQPRLKVFVEFIQICGGQVLRQSAIIRRRGLSHPLELDNAGNLVMEDLS
jgi:hypothetical protein